MSNDIFFPYLVRPKYREKEQYFKSKSMRMQTGMMLFIEICLSLLFGLSVILFDNSELCMVIVSSFSVLA